MYSVRVINKDMITTNEKAVLEKLVSSGVNKEPTLLSYRKQLDGLVLEKRVVQRVEKIVKYKPTAAINKWKWIKKLERKGLIEIDNTDRWKPIVKLTEEGQKQINN